MFYIQFDVDQLLNEQILYYNLRLHVWTSNFYENVYARNLGFTILEILNKHLIF